MRKLWAISTTIVLAAAPTAAEVTATLGPSEKQDESLLPYRSAELRIDNDSPHVIRAVFLRSRQGGPALVFPAAVPPNTKQVLAVGLPAFSLQQTYLIRLLGRHDAGADDETVLAELQAPITWPVALLAADDFIDPQAYLPWEYKLPAWEYKLPARKGHFRATVFGAAVLISLAFAGALLVPWPIPRLVLVIAVACGGFLAMWPALGTCDIIERTWASSTLVLTCRRTTEWRSDEDNLVPIYSSPRQMAEDTTVVHPGGGITVTLRPVEARLFSRRRR